MPTAADFTLLAPELFLFGATCVLLLADLFISQERRGLTHFLALLTLLGAAILTLRGDVSGDAFGGLFVRDGVGDLMKLFIYLVSGAAFIYAKPYLVQRDLFKGEFYMLCLFAVLGMMLLVSAGSLLMVYLGLELLALSSYALVALDRDSRLSTEAAMKYFVLGAIASGMLLYGMSMVYGATGSLDLDQIRSAAAVLQGDSRQLLLLGAVFVLVGIAFKFGAAPFHMWVPDVYHGAPTAVTLFIGSAPKLAAFGMAYRVLDGGLEGVAGHWGTLMAWLAVASLAVGNVMAIAQKNFKRMLAYSTISHVGFLFLALSNPSPQGNAAALFYVVSYALMAAGSFGVVILLSRRGFEADEIADFRGLGKLYPWHAFLVLLLMASLAGFPPLLGFFSKLAVLRAAVEGGMLWLALTGVVFAVIGAFYYLRVIKVMYFDEPVGAPLAKHNDRVLGVVLGVNSLSLLALGLAWNPIMVWCQRAFM